MCLWSSISETVCVQYYWRMHTFIYFQCIIYICPFRHLVISIRTSVLYCLNIVYSFRGPQAPRFIVHTSSSRRWHHNVLATWNERPQNVFQGGGGHEDRLKIRPPHVYLNILRLISISSVGTYFLRSWFATVLQILTIGRRNPSLTRGRRKQEMS